jgi:hypothetical protein
MKRKILFIQDGWLLCFYGFCYFFGTIKFLRLCRFNHRLLLFNQTLQYVKIELLSFLLMFSFIFLSFLCLFYLLFISKLFSCSTLLRTTQILLMLYLLKLFNYPKQLIEYVYLIQLRFRNLFFRVMSIESMKIRTKNNFSFILISLRCVHFSHYWKEGSTPSEYCPLVRSLQNATERK